MNDEDDSVPRSDALSLDDLMPSETLFSGCAVKIWGWENGNEAEAQDFGVDVLSIAKELSRYLDLSRLESIVIGLDYARALASVKRGDSMPPAAPTANEYGQGRAMAVPVVRDEEIWSVVVIWLGLARQLNQVDHPHHKLALHTFFHELVHVDDLRLFSRTYPGGWRAASPRSGRDDALQRVVNPCQSEYSAQRRSARAAPEHGLDLLDMLGEAMKDVDEQIRSARLSYRLHGDIDRFWPVVAQRLTFLFQAVGYGLGHADWVEANANDHLDLAARYQAKLEELSTFPSGWMLDACRRAVQPFFNLERWRGLDIYDPLIEVLEKFLNQNGVYTRAYGDSIYIDMP
jgi:hypothetical protein